MTNDMIILLTKPGRTDHSIEATAGDFLRMDGRKQHPNAHQRTSWLLGFAVAGGPLANCLHDPVVDTRALDFGGARHLLMELRAES